jgi:hypothetical protein
LNGDWLECRLPPPKRTRKHDAKPRLLKPGRFTVAPYRVRVIHGNITRC